MNKIFLLLTLFFFPQIFAETANIKIQFFNSLTQIENGHRDYSKNFPSQSLLGMKLSGEYFPWSFENYQFGLYGEYGTQKTMPAFDVGNVGKQEFVLEDKELRVVIRYDIEEPNSLGFRIWHTIWKKHTLEPNIVTGPLQHPIVREYSFSGWGGVGGSVSMRPKSFANTLLFEGGFGYYYKLNAVGDVSSLSLSRYDPPFSISKMNFKEWLKTQMTQLTLFTEYTLPISFGMNNSYIGLNLEMSYIKYKSAVPLVSPVLGKAKTLDLKENQLVFLLGTRVYF